MLRPLADSLWVVDMDHRVFGFRVGARMTVARTGDGLALVSPVRLSDEDVAAIRAAGEVKWIIAPNKVHHRFIPDARRLFPGARVLAAPGLRAKKPELPWDGELFSDAGALPVELQPFRVAGMPALEEVALLHRPSSTLILTDLFFNLSTDHWMTRLYLKLANAHAKPAQTSLLRKMVKDRAALRASAAALGELDFDRVIIAHGDVIETGGKGALTQALAWL